MQPTGQSTQVLVVDDLAGTREILKQMLSEIGYTNIQEAASVEEAFEKLRQTPAQLVISDYDMGGKMTGLDLLLAVRADPAMTNIPFIMISGKTDPHTISLAQQEGGAHFLFKPLNYHQLRNKVFEIIRRRFA